MQLQKQLSKKRGNKTYYKFIVSIPQEAIIKADLHPGDELEVETKKHEIKLKKK